MGRGSDCATDAAPQPVAPLPGERVGFVNNGGIDLRVREWGDPTAPAIVLLHGLRGYSGTWRALAAALGDRYRLVAFDARGRGESDWDPGRNYYTDAYLSDLEAVVDALELEQFVLLGHSMGGTTSYVYAARHAERLAALIVEDITAGSSVAGAGFERIVAEMKALPTHFADWSQARAYWRKLRPNVSDAAIEERLFESMRADADGGVLWRYDAEGIAETRVRPDPARIVDLWPVIASIRVPTLVIRGGRSDFCSLSSVRKLESENPALTHASVEEASHYVHDDAPEAFLRLVEGFLAGVRASANTAKVSGAQRVEQGQES
ncbi:MAG: alpha/beta hydrolase [Alphaproteobacteria bacterium]|nr:alpha/beta hydrolase [Alphaproteobacteria bacterium]MBU0794980.1 alpha/beta hydrolase [Alphaproteobacteria bacterium]MBU0876638.1 alpha/beta hydrolase [Alphaproteobacteria bacterium]MBU1769340.1 alpha/beta hydrolase [Alphaproteobacteria bacterium]